MRRFLLAGLCLLTPLPAQVSDNRSLNGRYYFRHTTVTTDASSAVTEVRTSWGTVNFDGNGSVAWLGLQMAGANPATSLNSAGVYTVKPGAFVTITNPLRSGAQLNARLGSGALVGSSTETGAQYFDIFIAVPAPTQALATTTLNGAYSLTSFEIPNGAANLVRSTWSKITANGNGSFGDTQVTGEAVNLGSALTTQSVPGITYTLLADGTGSLTLPMPASSTFAAQLIGGVKTIYASPDGSFFIGGGTTNSVHGLVIGIKAYNANAANTNWSGLYWGAGIRSDNGQFSSFAGSANAIGASAGVVWHRRLRQPATVFDFTPLNTFNLGTDGAGRALGNRVALASTGNSFAGSALSDSNSTSYEIYFGIRAPAQSGTGVFLNPQRIHNAASFAPAGNPVSPGELVTAFGTALAAVTGKATAFPFPNTLANVSVSVNNLPAPLYYVSPDQMSFLIPFGVTGSTASIVVTNTGVKSNTVEVPLALSAPGVFSLPQSGIGAGAILHANYTGVTADSPAKRGETVLVYLTGLGAVTPKITDGSAAPSNPLSVTGEALTVYVGGKQAAVQFKGLAPTLAGLYQINITIPSDAPLGALPLAIQTPEAFTDLVDIAVAQ